MTQRDWQNMTTAEIDAELGKIAGAVGEWKPTKKDCRMLEAIMKAAKQIHEEFDCLSDHVMTKRQIREQIATIIWKHVTSTELENLKVAIKQAERT